MKKAASIFLRANMKPKDVRNLSCWMENRKVTRYLNEGKNTPQELQELLETTPPPMLTYRFNQQGRFFLVCDEQEDSIGFVKLRQQNTPGCYEIVFAIGDEDLWGNGYGAKAVQAAQYEAFLEWRAKKITAKIYHDNVRSKNTVRHCGFHEEERLENLSCFSITMNEYLDFLEKKRA